MRLVYQKIIQSFMNYAASMIEDGDDPELQRRKIVLIVAPSMLIIVTIFMGLILALIGYWLACIIPLSYAIITFIGLLRYRRTLNAEAFQTIQMSLVMLLPALQMWIMGGFDSSGAMIIWSIFPPVAALILLDRHDAQKWFLGFACLVMVSALIDENVKALAVETPSWVKSIFYSVNILCASAGLFFLLRDTLNREHEYNKDLQSERDRLRTLSEDLSAAKNEAEASSKAKSDFLALMSHEIRTPMNAILGLTDIALRADLPPEQQENLSRIYVAGNALLQIINDILDFSKIEAGRLTLERVPMNLDRILEDLAIIVANDIEDKNLELLYKIDPRTPEHLIGDPLRLSQILLNLTINAKKFTDSGDIIVAVDLVGVEEETAELQFSVSDTGIGISDEQLKGLFTAFTQADSSTSRIYGGTGLGLTICRQLVELMHGEIWVESVLNEGSKFFFTVKLQIDPKFENHRELGSQNLSTLGRLKILVVDDNENARHIFKEYLEAFNFVVEIVDSGKKALEAVESSDSHEPFDIAIIDYRMPGLNGLDTAVQLNKNLVLQHQPKIILVTAASKTVDDEPTKKLSVLSEILKKPINPSVLLDAITNVMSGSTSSARIRQTVLEEINEEDLQSIQGARILLVEDNEFNQQIALEYLRLGYFEVHIASNGLECLDLFERYEFDCILMDIHMPLMDGYTATQKIKANQRYSGTPIIAMTANVAEEDKQRAFAAGMVDHIAKPVLRSDLYASLLEWIPEKAREITDFQIASTEPFAAVSLPPRLSGCKLSKALINVAGNRALLKKLLINFYSDQREDGYKLRNAMEEGDVTLVVTMAHTLKTIFGTLAHENLQNTCASIEAALKSGETEIQGFLDIFAKDFSDFIQDLELWALPLIQSSAASSVFKKQNKDLAKKKLRELIKKLEAFDPSASETLIELIQASSTPDYFSTIKPLVESFEFTKALDKLKQDNLI